MIIYFSWLKFPVAAIFIFFIFPSVNINRVYRFHIEIAYPLLFKKRIVYYAEIKKAVLLPSTHSIKGINIIILHRRIGQRVIIETNRDFAQILRILKEKEIPLEIPPNLPYNTKKSLRLAGVLI